MAEKPVAPRKLVVIEEGILTSMSSSAEYVKAFPFLAALGRRPVARRGCGSCGTAAKERAAVYGAAKAAIAGMGADQKRKLKEMLNAVRVRVTYLNGAKKAIELTF